MRILLACREGLLLHDGFWRQLDCPLASPDLVAHSDGAVTAADNAAHLLWHSRLLPCDRDIEALLLWQHYALALSSDTDCLSIADPDGWLVTARVGIYPQDMCLSGSSVLVCGGADGQVHHLSLPELHILRTFHVPGVAMRIHANGDAAHVLCSAGDEHMYTLLGRIDLATGAYAEIARLPGLPGAVQADAAGVWAAVTERLYHFPTGETQPDILLDGFGLIRHLERCSDGLLITDPLEDMVAQLTFGAGAQLRPLYRSTIGQAIFI